MKKKRTTTTKKEYSLKTRLRITQLAKACFSKVNELKLTHIELFSFLHFKWVAANVPNCFGWPI